MVYEYDVALSFAGEDRAFVENCAEILRSLNINVFYDNYEKDVLLGKDLYRYLSDIYQNRARFAVVFVSESYKKKRWTKHELEYITARKFKQDEEYLLPVKLDETELRYYLPDYEINIIGSEISFNCPKEDFFAKYPVGFLMELHRQNLVERAFILPAIVPN